MRNLFLVGIVALAAAISAPAMAADYPEYPVIDYIEIPQVDYGLAGGLYLRGSVGANAWLVRQAQHCNCPISTFESPGYGYSLGVGIGYETGDGFRADLTLDFIDNYNLKTTVGYSANLRSGLLLANVYYDFPLGGGSLGAEGGTSLYVGAALGAAKNYSEVYSGGALYAWGDTVEAAAAVMAGVSYDMGAAVADIGYRGIYMPKVMSQPANMANAYVISDNFIHELRASLRYRFY